MSMAVNTSINERSHCGQGLDKSEESENSTSKIKAELLKSHLCGQSEKVQDGDIMIYKPNMKLIVSNEVYNLQKYEFGKEKNAMQEKVIMLVGSTGSGKTTLINGLVNYIFAVDWGDSFRFKVITEPRGQTIHLSSYTIHHQEGLRVPYTLTIIDTPGLGDFQGIERDTEITEQIRTILTTGGIDKLDAVGFVVQSCLPRLTPTQRYIFDQILSLFGKDIAENILLLLTFADGQKPQVLSGIKEANIPYRKFFKFNNSALYAFNRVGSREEDNGVGEDNVDAMFWKMGERSFERFLKDLSVIKSKSLTLTKEVLNERHQLAILIAGIRVNVQIGLHKLEQLRKEVNALTSHQADIDRSKNFVYTITEETFVKVSVPSGQYVTNCLNCNRTCHEVCEIQDDDRKQECCVMLNGHCRICPANCYWKLHKNIPYKFVCKQVQVQKTAEDLKKKYHEATKKKLSAVNLVKKINEEFEAVQRKVLRMTESARNILARLEEIAFKPNPLSTVEYIDIVIESEKSQARPGWHVRTSDLLNLRKQAEYLKKIVANEFEPFPNL
ncbi:uncharacterized protein LOC135215535 [Macrobrachium nipponense]|uniref:uncharacterized protein LOC135215535 n=1 Tax=Macrobrachium nipponense TaxID=159736 RepID=UPI0030C8AE51